MRSILYEDCVRANMFVLAIFYDNETIIKIFGIIITEMFHVKQSNSVIHFIYHSIE